MRLRLGLTLAFLVVPLFEILIIIQVGQAIGGWPTAGLLLGESLIGAIIVRREGAKTWVALRDTFRSARLPTRELADGALVLVGGTLLLTPGFLTDVVGFLLVLPPTRPLARRWLLGYIERRARSGRGSTRRRRGGSGATRVVPGEVVGSDGGDDTTGAQGPR